MIKKNYQLSVLTMMMAAMLSISSSSCTKDSDSSGAPVNSGGGSVESKSPIIGTWKNTVSSDMEYCIEFYKDGTGVYIKEGTTESNFKEFSKSYFKFSTIAYEDNATQTSSNTSNSSNSTGSIEISFVDSSKGSSTGTYVVTSDGKLQLELLKNIDKSIFYKSNEALPTSINIDGLWKFDAEIDNENVVFMFKVNQHKSGYLAFSKLINPGIMTYNTSPLIEFSSYEVIGDIITLKDTKQNNSEDYKLSSEIRIKRISQDNILINIGGIIQYSMTKAVQQTFNPNTIVGSWIASGVENYYKHIYFLRIHPNKEMVYYKLENSWDTYSEKEIMKGTYSIYDDNFIVFANKLVTSDSNNAEYYNLFPSNISASSLSMTLPNGGTKYKFDKATQNSNASKLYGTWRCLNGNYEYWGFSVATITFNSDGQYIIKEKSGNDLIGDYYMYDTDSFYLFGNTFSGDYDFKIEGDDRLVIDGKNYFVKIGGDGPVSGEPGTQNNPFTVFDAVAKCKETGETPTTEIYYVKGIVDGGYTVDSYHNATIKMVDYEGSSEVFTAYRVKGADGKGLKEGYTIPKGATVIVSGQLVNYRNSIPEIAVNTGTLISVNGKTPEIDE